MAEDKILMIMNCTHSPMYPLDVDMKEASSMLEYSGPSSINTFLNEWNSEPCA